MSNKRSVPTNVILDHEARMSSSELADFIETIAKRIRENGSFNVVHGEQDVAVNLPETLTVEIKYEQKGEKHSFELEFEWLEGQPSGKVEIR